MRYYNYEKSLARYKNIVLLRSKGVPVKEIAKRHKISEGTVYRRISKGEPVGEYGASSVLTKELGCVFKGRELTRMLVRFRDNFTCQGCGDVRTFKEVQKYNKNIKGLKGRTKLFDVHHLNGHCGKNSKGYDSVKDIDGMITLCHRCHYNRHDHSHKLTKS